MKLHNENKLKVLTWNIHRNYLYYLTQTDCVFYIPIKEPRTQGFFGKTEDFLWGKNVIEVKAEDVKNLDIDCIIFQSNFNPKEPYSNYIHEQVAILSNYQIKNTAKLFVEHDPPRQHPTDTKHILFNSIVPLVHVTDFNKLMWDSGTTPTAVIDHGVKLAQNVRYIGQLNKGIVVIDNIQSRERQLGYDIFEKVRKEIPLDIIGINSKKIGGLGEVTPYDLPEFISHYRFYFHPARYTSLGLSVIEAMMVGLPIVGLSTTQLPGVITNGKNGYVSNDLDNLILKMKLLLNYKELADFLGIEAKKTAQKNFNIDRFTADWKNLIELVVHENMLRRYQDVNLIKEESRYL